LEEASHEPLIFAADLAFRDYPWKAHHAVFDERVGRRSRYVETWYFLILIEVAKLAVGEDQAQPISPDSRATVEALRVFLRDNWGHFAFAHHEVFTRPHYKLTKTLDPTILGNKLGSLQWTTVDAGHLGSELRDVNGWLRSALASILRPDAEYWVVFDELDLDFAPDEAEYVESITGLLIAVGQFQEWARSELEGVARAMLLLRDDIYDSLHFQDKNKISDSLVEELRWSQGLTSSDSLRPVINERIRVLLGTSADDPFPLVFGDGQATADRIYRHMVALTYSRPRDLIKFANLSLERAQQNRRIIQSITARDVIGARRPFSQYLYNELDDEIRVHAPHWEQWCELLRASGTEVVSKRSFEHHCRQNKNFTGGASPTVIMEQLYRFGVVGMGRVRADQTVYDRWQYKSPSVAFDTRATYLVVHPGLCDVLGIPPGTVAGFKSDQTRRSIKRTLRRDDLT